MEDTEQTLETQGSEEIQEQQAEPQAQAQERSQADVYALAQKSAPPVQTTGEGQLPAWVNQFKGNLQKEKAFHQYPTISDFGTAYLDQGKKYQELEARMKEAMFLPGEDATEEDVKGFFQRLGRPETADGYDLKLAEEFAGYEFDQDNAKALKAEFHKAGLSNGQANHLFNAISKMSVERLQANTQGYKATEEGLRKEWGQQYDENLELSRRAMSKYFGDVVKKLDERGYGNDPDVLKGFHKIGVELGEDRFTFGSEGPKRGRGLADTYDM